MTKKKKNHNNNKKCTETFKGKAIYILGSVSMFALVCAHVCVPKVGDHLLILVRRGNMFS